MEQSDMMNFKYILTSPHLLLKYFGFNNKINHENQISFYSGMKQYFSTMLFNLTDFLFQRGNCSC